MGQTVNDLIKLLQSFESQGPFAAGVILGWAITAFGNAAARKERQEEMKAYREREAELRKQLDLKEKRIDALHDKLLRLNGASAEKSKEKKK